MKGLELSRSYFKKWGLPFIKERYSKIVKSIAAGRVYGSDIIGADDKWSRDHDWGPCFNLWLTEKDYKNVGKRLAKEINKTAPEAFKGFRYHFFGKKKAGIKVESINSFFEEQIYWKYPPKRVREWFEQRRGQSLVDLESWLYFLKHGVVFYDPLGKFSARKKSFSKYPRDVRYRVISDVCMEIWHTGQYKFCMRLVHRKDPLAIQMSVGRFVEAVMRLCFLLNNDYAPHWVWLHHEFRKLPEGKKLGCKLRQLVNQDNLEKQRDIVRGVCQFVLKRLLEKKLARPAKPNIRLAAEEIARKIKDKWVREAYSL